MSINASVQQFSAGIASFGSGLIIGKGEDGSLTNFGLVGVITTIATLVCIPMARRLQFVEGGDGALAHQGGLARTGQGAGKMPGGYKAMEGVSETP